MNTDELLEKIGKVIDEKLDPLRSQLYEQGADIGRLLKGQKRIEEDVKNLELKVAVIQDQNTKDHSEIMDFLTESNEINYHVLKQELKKLEERIANLEKGHHKN